MGQFLYIVYESRMFSLFLCSDNLLREEVCCETEPMILAVEIIHSKYTHVHAHTRFYRNAIRGLYIKKELSKYKCKCNHQSVPQRVVTHITTSKHGINK